MGNVNVYAFLKFAKAEYLHKMRNEGLLHLKSLRYYSELEDAEKGDAFEGVDRIWQPKHIGELTIRTNTSLGDFTATPVKDLSGPVRTKLNRVMDCNVYCLFAITEPGDGELVDARNFGLGDSAVLILNPSKFRSRFYSAAHVAGLACQGSPVEYYSGEDYSGTVGPFRKRSSYAHQHEHRFVVRPGSGVPRELIIGSMKDIMSEVLPASEINRYLDFSPKSFREAGLAQLAP
jgi:hypothetical protein